MSKNEVSTRCFLIVLTDDILGKFILKSAVMKKKGSKLGKYIIGAIGVLFFLYGSFLTILWLAGNPTDAQVVSFRREMGERDETIRNQYTYTYSYEFMVADKKYLGNSKKVQSPLFLKNDGKTFLKVHYLKCCPYLNCPADDFNPKYTIIIYFGIATLMGYFFNKMR